MTLEQTLSVVEDAARSLRAHHEDHTALTTQRDLLVMSEEHLHGQVKELEKIKELLASALDKERDKCDKQAEQIGELKATLKQLLAEQMALAGRAADMLRTLEEKPKPVLKE